MKEKDSEQNFVVSETISIASDSTSYIVSSDNDSNIALSDNSIIADKYSGLTNTLTRNFNDCFSQDYCCNLSSCCEQKEISEIQYETYIYPLRKIICGLWNKTNDVNNPFLFSALELPNIYGKGKTAEDALNDWQKEFHLKFQDIYYQQHWERTEDAQNLYNAFEEFVDIPKHLHLTPIIVQQTGKIIDISDNKREIEWLDESRNIVDLAECPSELANYKVGEYFRAEMLRKFETRELIKIRSIKTTCYRDYTDEEIQEFFDSLPVVSLPPSKYWN
ncbi:MAG: hypothetical protein LBE18_05830 [Planctomycetaceae bacterium]|jgi:hypothetical protein|nr:hypothetical protein [Planctomycetaceae bacterium]